MKRLLLVFVALAIALVPAAIPGSAGANSALHSYAVGGGFAPSLHFAVGTQHFAFSAHQEVGTTSPKGHVVLRYLDTAGETIALISGPVTCLVTAATPDGGTATITFRVEKSTFVVPTVGTHAAFAVIDAGQSDAISNGINNSGPSCLPPSSSPPVPVTKGNIVVALQSPAVATPLSGSWYSIGSDGSLSILTETGWEVMQ